MSDVLDEAREKEERERDASIARVLAQVAQGPSETHCIDCGGPIPLARRQAVKPVWRCIDCQEDFEGT